MSDKNGLFVTDAKLNELSDPVPFPNGLAVGEGSQKLVETQDGNALLLNGSEIGNASTLDGVFGRRSTQFRELGTVSPQVQIQESSHLPLDYSHYDTETEGSGEVNDITSGRNKPFYELKVYGNGDKAVLKSKFRFKYVPSLEMMWGGAVIMQNQLQPGQVYRLGYFNDDTGVFMAFTANDALLTFRKKSKSPQDYQEFGRGQFTYDPWNRPDGKNNFSLTDGAVFRARGSLYGMGDWTVRGLIPDGNGRGRKEFADLVTGGVSGESTVETYNLRVRAELENVGSSATNSAITGELEAVLLGEFQQDGRQPEVVHWNPGGLDIDGTGDPNGFLAVRHHPEKKEVPMALSRYTARATEDAHIYTRRVPESLLSLSGWSKPRYKGTDEVAFQETTSSFTIPTSGGDMVGDDGPSLDVPSAGNQNESGQSRSVFESFRVPDGYYLVFGAETEPGSANTDPLSKLVYEMKELP